MLPNHETAPRRQAIDDYDRLMKTTPLGTGSRRGELSTRSKLIEVAGQLFADRGFEATTGKEICERAGVNAAAISYHFGGMEMLYREVLLAAYDSMIALDEFAALLVRDNGPDERLKLLCRIMVNSFAQPVSEGWEWRVISREVLSPSPEIDELRESRLIPKILILRDLVCELIELPPEHPAVVQGCLHVIAPIVLLQVGDWSAIGQALPGFHIDQANREQIAERFHAFIAGGLAALGLQSRV